MYQVEVTFNEDGGYDESFETMNAAVDFIERWAGGRIIRAWINNIEVKVRNGMVLDTDDNPIVCRDMVYDRFRPLSRPKPARIITNPATLVAMGVL